MTDDLVKRLRERNDLRMLTASMPPLPVKDWLCNEAANRIEQLEREKASWKGAYDGAVLALTERNKKLEAALRECEQIVKRKQDENIQKTEWQGSNIAHAKAKATATRCGEILGEIRKHVSAALGEKKDG